MSFNKEGLRVCDNCGNVMHEGYCIEDGIAHYCCDDCLHAEITEEEYIELYDNGNGSSYWTEWYDED